MILLSGNSNQLLANHISNHAGIALSEMKLTRFADGEIFCEIHQNIRGEDVFIIQSTCNPANDNLMELLILIDACKRASAGRITAVMPYLVMLDKTENPPLEHQYQQNFVPT